MPRCRRVGHHFPESRFDQIGRPPVRETARDLCDAGDFSPGPDLLQGPGHVGKGRKVLTPGMQEHQIVVALADERVLRPQPEDASLEACQPPCGLGFGEVTIPPFVILHARLGDEQLPMPQSAYHIGQVGMRFALKRVANREWCVLRDGQAVGGRKWRTNVATSVTDDLGVVFEPEQEPLFELTTEWLPDRGSSARLETGNPPRNGAACNFKQINAINSRCNPRYSSCTSGTCSVPTGSLV